MKHGLHKIGTHTKDGDICGSSSLYSLPGYVFLQRNRNVFTCGGIGIFLKHEIKFKRWYDLQNHLEYLWIEICLKNSKSVLIGCYYRSPETSKYFINNFSNVFKEQWTNVVKTNKEIIIVSDVKMGTLILIKKMIENLHRYLTSSD